MRQTDYDAIVIGGGLYGCMIALQLREFMPHVALLEKEAHLMQRASYNNQARIHRGYHYPRSILTSLRSRVNFPRFVQEYADCVESSFESYYAIGRLLSKVNAVQFRQFCNRIEAPIQTAPKAIKKLFNPALIEEVFLAQEYAFDANKLKRKMRERLGAQGVALALNSYVEALRPAGDWIQVAYRVDAGPAQMRARYVFNCAYSQINQVLSASQLPLIPLKHEFTEMPLVQAPDEIKHAAITVMDGPFFSVMPFPSRRLHTLSHVRYTPHHYWQDGTGRAYLDAHAYFSQVKPRSRFIHMLKDAQRYAPLLRECRYADSLWEVKTVLPQSEIDDSRPILFQAAKSIPNLISIMGGKIDNIFDVQDRLHQLFCAKKLGS